MLINHISGSKNMGTASQEALQLHLGFHVLRYSYFICHFSVFPELLDRYCFRATSICLILYQVVDLSKIFLREDFLLYFSLAQCFVSNRYSSSLKELCFSLTINIWFLKITCNTLLLKHLRLLFSLLRSTKKVKMRNTA